MVTTPLLTSRVTEGNLLVVENIYVPIVLNSNGEKVAGNGLGEIKTTQQMRFLKRTFGNGPFIRHENTIPIIHTGRGKFIGRDFFPYAVPLNDVESIRREIFENARQCFVENFALFGFKWSTRFPLDTASAKACPQVARKGRLEQIIGY